MQQRILTNGKILPWWTWIAPFVLFYIGGFISQKFTMPTGSILFYLPIPMGLILIQWWGPRVLAGLLLYSVIDSKFWATESPLIQPLTLCSESATIFFSWYLFSSWQKGKAWLPNITSILQFIGLGILVPITINSTIFYLARNTGNPDILKHISMVWTADLASSLALTLPTLFFLTPEMERLGLSITRESEYVKPSIGLRFIQFHRIEIALLFSCILILSLQLPIEKYWFIHGLFCVYVGVRFGFGLSLLANLAVFIFTYLVPYLTITNSNLSWAVESNLLNIHFGMCLLSITACVTGRVISDLKSVERKLNIQYKELEQTHEELDRFVYSASHDLSAPIKSILGLVNISRLESNPAKYYEYIDKIEICTKKLDTYIKEILDYSHNSRLEKTLELINLRELTKEVLEHLPNTEHLKEIDIKIVDQDVPQITTDRMRLKMILTNLLSNALKYQNRNDTHIPMVAIHSELSGDSILIHVKDNGEGIREEYKGKIFKMFFRGSVESNGSGLGLYIAKEAAEKLDGKITVESVYGKGSTFTLSLPQNPKMTM
jgi:two-component system, sensor histidine kinase